MTAKRRARKGQLFSQDIAIATMLFMASLAFAIFLWNSHTDEINHAERMRDFQKLADETVEKLIRTPGVEGWNLYNNGTPGIATDRVINETLAANFIDTMNSTNSSPHYGYNMNKNRLGLGEYDFYMNVTDLEGNLQRVNGRPFVAGESPFNLTYSDSLAVQRTAIYNGTIVRINFVIWK